MSAKRLKVEGMKGERVPRTRPRPLPSLSSPLLLQPVADEPDSSSSVVGDAARSPLGALGSPAAVSRSTLSPPATGVEGRVGGGGGGGGGSSAAASSVPPGDNLIRIESALGLHSSFRQTHSLLSFHDVYALLGKVQLLNKTSTTSTAVGATATDESTISQEASKDAGASPAGQHRKPYDGIDDLSEEERLLYHLLRVAAPTLYNVCLLTDEEAKQRRRDALFSSKVAAQASSPEPSPHAGGKRRYYLEKVGFSGNRIKELRRLVQEYDPHAVGDDDDDDIILGAIRKHRDAAATTSVNKKSNTSGRLGPSSDDSVVISAGMTIDERVRAREQARLKRNEDIARATADAVAAGDTTMDRAWLVRVADALWRHTSDILARQNRVSHLPSSTQPQKKKVSFCTLTLRDAVSVLKQALSAPGSNSVDKKTTSSALVAAILELTKLAPKWIQHTGSGDGNGKVLKDDTLWIYHSHYQEARALVSGKVPATTKPSPRMDLTTKAGGSAPKRSLETPAALAPQGHVVTSDDIGATSNLPKKQRLDRQSPRDDKDLPPFRLRDDPSVSSATERTPPPASARKKSPLRINPHLILSDADYTGGEVIVPTFFDSPRGLKILFDNINAGNRI